jgi:hypothetical protein
MANFFPSRRDGWHCGAFAPTGIDIGNIDTTRPSGVLRPGANDLPRVASDQRSQRLDVRINCANLHMNQIRTGGTDCDTVFNGQRHFFALSIVPSRGDSITSGSNCRISESRQIFRTLCCQRPISAGGIFWKLNCLEMSGRR